MVRAVGRQTFSSGFPECLLDLDPNEGENQQVFVAVEQIAVPQADGGIFAFFDAHLHPVSGESKGSIQRQSFAGKRY